MTTEPKTPYEAASYDLIKFRERRLADRRFIPRESKDRRVQPVNNDAIWKAAPNTPEGKKDIE